MLTNSESASLLISRSANFTTNIKKMSHENWLENSWRERRRKNDVFSHILYSRNINMHCLSSNVVNLDPIEIQKYCILDRKKFRMKRTVKKVKEAKNEKCGFYFSFNPDDVFGAILKSCSRILNFFQMLTYIWGKGLTETTKHSIIGFFMVWEKNDTYKFLLVEMLEALVETLIGLNIVKLKDLFYAFKIRNLCNERENIIIMSLQIKLSKHYYKQENYFQLMHKNLDNFSLHTPSVGRGETWLRHKYQPIYCTVLGPQLYIHNHIVFYATGVLGSTAVDFSIKTALWNTMLLCCLTHGEQLCTHNSFFTIIPAQLQELVLDLVPFWLTLGSLGLD
ncbi:hypothetical protein VP01_506g1 [Puccinia sorghi]|uniref:Uncharacterized protein n=1 Tax=Puccinia sorghi TaxID=27349 RepID=A0A0L6ULF7_9BASI|nr:hypothetical protein VP01_506g1 [Puccinia sorghi]